jgi:CheY-like chemotaxis protein
MGEKILLVEDEPLLRKFMCEVLQRVGGFEVDDAEDGLRALKLLRIALSIL